MTLDEARVKIEIEFIDRYYQFLEDVKVMDPEDTSYGTSFAWKYGYVLGGDHGVREITKNGKDTQKNLIWFQSRIFSGRWFPNWLKEGYPREVIIELNRSGFLSHDEYFSSRARSTRHTDFYYISQATAKEIYKKYKR